MFIVACRLAFIIGERCGYSPSHADKVLDVVALILQRAQAVSQKPSPFYHGVLGMGFKPVDHRWIYS